MTSNFYLDGVSSVMNYKDITERKSTYTDGTCESETEDEEVRMNCIGGFRGIEDSDMNTTENSDDDDALSDDELVKDGFAIANFVANPCKSKLPLICPKPKMAEVKRLSPLDEGDNEQDSVHEENNQSFDSNETDNVEIVEEVDTSVHSTDQVGSGDILESLEYPQSFEHEITEILSSIGDALEQALDESESSTSNLYFIGVMNDTDIVSPVRYQPKRGLCQSETTLDCSNTKMKKAKSVSLKELQMNVPPITLLQSDPSDQQECYHPITMLNLLKLHDNSPILLLSNDTDDELDRQLGEELVDQYDDDDHDDQHHETPVPLLTPPASPTTVEWEGSIMTLCEWPSNLIIDSAIQAAVNELRPMSPKSLVNLERYEHDRFCNNNTTTDGTTIMNDIGTEFLVPSSSSLFTTPQLTGVLV